MKIEKKVVLYNLVSVTIILALFEAGTRIFMNHNLSFADRQRSSVDYIPSGYGRFWAKPAQDIFYHEKGKIYYSKVNFHINKYGYRGRDFPLHKPAGEIRIVVMGGSHVFDIFSYDHEGAPGFPALVEDSLRKSGYNIRMISAGQPGTCTNEFLCRSVLDLARYEPDYVVINSTWNDIKWISIFDSTTQLIKTPPLAVMDNPLIRKVNIYDHLFGWSVLYRKLRDHYWIKKLDISPDGATESLTATAAGIKDTAFKAGLAQYDLNIRALICLIRAIHARPVLALEERFPGAKNSTEDKKRIRYDFVNNITHRSLVYLYKNCDSILMTEAKENNIPLLDVNRYMEGNPAYFKDHIHATPQGSRIMAHYYTAFIREIIKPAP